MHSGRQRPTIRLCDPWRQKVSLIANIPQHSDSQVQEFLRWRQEFLNVDRQQFDPDPWHIGGKLDQIANKSIQFDHWRQKFNLVASGPTIQQFDSIHGKSSFSSQPTVTIHSVLGRPWVGNNSIINHCRQKFVLIANNSILGCQSSSIIDYNSTLGGHFHFVRHSCS